jgi:predicted acyltransferase
MALIQTTTRFEVEARGSGGSVESLAPASGAATPRLPEIDVLRGLAVAGMILVTSPGSWDSTYTELKHAPWHGWTAADMVFPTFLFVVGIALALTWGRGFARAPLREILWRVLRRCAALTALGLILNALPLFDWPHLRIPGILQRIALCYAAATLFYVATARSDADGARRLAIGWLVGGTMAVLAGYWMILRFAPTPGFGAGRLDSYGSFPAYMDRVVFTIAHLWPYGTTPGVGVTFDPEGLVSTLGATANVLAGTLTGLVLKSNLVRRKTLLLVAAGTVLILLGLLLDPLLPIIKKIWTSTFAILSVGVSVLSLAVVRTLMHAPLARRAVWPLQVLGGNAILAFILSQLLGAVSGLEFLRGSGGARVSPQAYGFDLVRSVIPEPRFASLVCALGILAFIILVIAPMHSRRIHLSL